MNSYITRFISRSASQGYYLNVLRPAHTLSKAETDIELLSKQDPQVSQISGVTVASVENYSPLAEVSVIVKAGSRYEKAQHEGVVHCLRNCSVLSTKNNSAFALTRTLEMLGAKLSATSTREHLIYSLKCQRDNINAGLQILTDVVANPAFKTHELERISPALNVDLTLHNTNPGAVLFEALHKAAFRGGLGNSLYAPSFLIGNHTPEMLNSFVHENFSPSRTSIVGLGISQDVIQENMNELFHMSGSASSSNSASKFAPGEIRISADLPCVHAAIVAEGTGLSNTKEFLSLALLQSMLGQGSTISPLGQAAAKCTSNPFYVSGLSVNYSDAGLFGVYIVGQPEDMRSLVKAVVSGMRDLPKNISEKAVAVAKHQLKAKLLIERETQQGLLSAMALEVSQFGKMTDVKELEKTIDELQSSDIAAIASKVVKSKPAMAALGNLHSTPYIDELL